MPTPATPKHIAHYKLGPIIGRGGMGVVYLGEDDRLGRQVAVKCLNPNIADSQLKQRLQREAKLLAQLNHVNIVQIYDFVDQEDSTALVMEYVDGRTLRQYLREQLCSQQQKIQFLIQISEGLAAAHQRGIVHRDLKLDNVLISNTGQLKLTDFGVAKSQDPDAAQLTQHDAVSGSYSAMSPEQIRGENVGPSSDLFALGILACRILGDEHPFGDDLNQLLMVQAILQNEPKALSEMNRDLPAGLSDLVALLLDKDAQRRPNDARWVSLQLQQFLSEVSGEFLGELTAHSMVMPSVSEKPSNSPKTKKLMWLGGTLLLLILAVFSGGKIKEVINPFEKAHQYIAVLPPVLEAVDGLDYASAKETVFYALQEGVIALENLHLISEKDVAAAVKSGAVVGQAVGADIVIETTLQCEKNRCQIIMSKLAGERWSVDGQQRSTLLLGNLLEMYQMSSQNLGSLFLDRDGLQAISAVISEAGYNEYIDLNIEYQNRSIDAVELLDRLDALQMKAPRFAPLYRFYTTVALDFYHATQEEDAIERLQRLLSTADTVLPKSVTQYRNWFDLYLNTGKQKLALELAKKIEALGAETFEIESLYALVAYYENDYPKAVEHYSKAIKLRPNQTSYVNLALASWSMGDLLSAEKYLLSALKLNPENVKARRNLGMVYLTDGRLGLAREIYQKNHKDNPSVGDLTNMGLINMLERKYDEASPLFIKAEKLSPNKPVYILNLADNFALRGDTEKSQEYYQKIIDSQSDETKWSHLRNRAQAYIHTGQVMPALKAVEKSQRLAADNSEVAYSSALVYSVAQNYQSAIIWVETSLELGIGKVWFSLPWFDKLCAHAEYGPEFKKLTGLQCQAE